MPFDAKGAVELAVEVLEADPAGQFDDLGVREVISEAGEEPLIDVLVAARDRLGVRECRSLQFREDGRLPPQVIDCGELALIVV